MNDARPRAGARPVDAAEARFLFEASFKSAAGILLAISGGPDSMALCALAAGWSARPPLAAATVDHGLRADSAEEAALAARLCADLGLPHRILSWTGPKPGTGVQEAARAARYALLAQEARRLGFTHVATAHHADDQAETVLMRLAAGSGLAGLAGMRALSDRDGIVLVRPFLAIPKARLVATCEALGLAFARDPSNDDPRFGRTLARIALEQLAGEGVTSVRLARLAERAARADEALAQTAAAALGAGGLRRAEGVTEADWRALARQAGGLGGPPRRFGRGAGAGSAAAALDRRPHRHLGARRPTRGLACAGATARTRRPPACFLKR